MISDNNISKIKYKNAFAEAIETVLKEQQKILNTTLADTGEKKRKLRTETMNTCSGGRP